MELRNLRTFVHAAELNSFSKAANRLNYAQSTVTAQIDALEKELGVQLFHRNGKKISLSEAGQELLRYAYRFLQLENEVYQSFGGEEEPSGDLCVGILESLSASGHMKGLEQFLRDYPAVRLRVRIGTTIELMEKLENGEIDAAFLLDTPVMNRKFRTVDRQSVRILFIAPPGSAWGGKRVLLCDLAEERWLLTERGCNYRRLLEEELLKRELSVFDPLEIGSTSVLIRCVSDGLGISLLPEYNLTEALRQGRGQELPGEDCRMEMEFQALIHKDRWLSPSIQKICEYMKYGSGGPLKE